MLHKIDKSIKDNLLSLKESKTKNCKTLKQGFFHFPFIFYKHPIDDLMNLRKFILFKEASVVLGVYCKTICKLFESHSIPFYRSPAIGLSFNKKELVLLLDSYRNPA